LFTMIGLYMIGLLLHVVKSASSGSSPPCPYKDCLCEDSGSYIYCLDQHLNAMPTLETGTFSQTRLNLEYNNIHAIQSSDLLPTLTEIVFSWNRLTSIPPAVLDLPHLTTLDVSYNKLTSIDDCLWPPSLTDLDVSNNDITSIHKELSNSLTSFNANYNNISSIEDAVFPSSLSHLWLSHNRLTKVPSDLPHSLTFLSIGNNLLTSTPPSVSELPPFLTDLYLGHNALTSIPLAVSHLSQLDYLGVSYNNITSFDNIVLPNSLVLLRVDGNMLTSIPDLTYLPNIKEIYMAKNNISNTPSDVLPTSLTELLLSDNSLTAIPPVVSTLTRLVGLGVSGNKITSLDHISFPTSLEALLASDNSITTITSLTFNDPAAHNNLKTLDLKNNPITSIATDAFKHLQQLEGISLENTRLARLPLALADLPNVGYIHLDMIPDLACTCDESSLSTWYRESMVLRGNCRLSSFSSTSISSFLTSPRTLFWFRGPMFQSC